MNITALRNYKTESKLERATKRILLNNMSKDYCESFIQDLMSYGCVSGMIGELIYYSDTYKFFTKHKEEINELLSETMSSCGFTCMSELFGDKYDEEDPLCQDSTNTNLLAWFAFEESSRKIASDLGVEI